MSGVGCRVSGVGCRVSGVGCRVSGVALGVPKMLGVMLPVCVSDCTACGYRCINVGEYCDWGWINLYLPSLPEYVTPTDPCRFAALSPSTSLWY